MTLLTNWRPPLKRATSTNITRTGTSKPASTKQVLYFLAGVIILTALFHFYIIRDLKTVRTMAIIPLTWIPGIVAVACSHHFGNRERDLGLAMPGRLSIMYAYIVPAVCVLLTLFLLVLFGIGQFKLPQISILKVALIQPTLGVAVGFTLALGEEVGWRGYLHTHLMRARVPEPLLVTGLIWSAWHWPLILFADYSTSPAPWVSVFLFTITMTSFSVFLGWLREYSKSVFPCALAHAVHTTWLENITPEFYRAGQMSPYFSGESGFIMAIIYLLIAFYLYRYHVAASNY